MQGQEPHVQRPEVEKAPDTERKLRWPARDAAARGQGWQGPDAPREKEACLVSQRPQGREVDHFHSKKIWPLCNAGLGAERKVLHTKGNCSS